MLLMTSKVSLILNQDRPNRLGDYAAHKPELTASTRNPNVPVHGTTGCDMEVAASDEQLVRQMAAGDERALAELHRRYAPYLAALARRMVGEPDEADASVQAAFVSAWDTAARFDPHKLSAKTWLVTLAHRLVMRRVREQEPAPLASKNRDVLPRPVDPAGEADVNPPGSSATAEARDLLERAYFQGCTLQDLADLTGRPLDDIKQELRAALEQLIGTPGEREL